jgi:hypothetical protein
MQCVSSYMRDVDPALPSVRDAQQQRLAELFDALRSHQRVTALLALCAGGPEKCATIIEVLGHKCETQYLPALKQAGVLRCHTRAGRTCYEPNPDVVRVARRPAPPTVPQDLFSQAAADAVAPAGVDELTVEIRLSEAVSLTLRARVPAAITIPAASSSEALATARAA